MDPIMQEVWIFCAAQTRLPGSSACMPEACAEKYLRYP